jgi:hypothetical protein
MNPKILVSIILFIFLFTPVVYSQVLWGIDTEDLLATRSWQKKIDSRGHELFSVDQIGDFDYVSSNQKGFMFYRENPPDYMFEEVYAYLLNVFGAPSSVKDFVPLVKGDLSVPEKIKYGKWKYNKQWDTGFKITDLVWKENKLYVQCLFK